MKETEIRDRIQNAFGDSSCPPGLDSRIASRLGEPSRPQGQPRLLGVVAVILALAIIGTLVFVRMHSSGAPLPAVTPPARPSPQAGPVAPRGHIPQADLDRAQLSTAGALVTPLDLTSTSSGRTVTLIGAYADTSRTVLFLRTLPSAGFPQVLIYDDTGFLNASSEAVSASFGDEVFILNTGPHPGSDGLAHVRADIREFMPSLTPSERGTWSFSFSLRLAGSTGLSLNPPLTSVGSWSFAIEALDATPATIHLQVVIDGAAVGDIQQSTIRLLDATGNPLTPVDYSAGTTVPKSQITSVPPRNTRVNASWTRPAVATNLTLVITGGGSQYVGTLQVGAQPAPTPGKGGGSVSLPTVYPNASENLLLDGAFSAAISSGHPNACGRGSGPDGIAVYAFGLWFQVDQIWYLVTFDTDKTVGPYRGPGTYTVKANIYPYVAATGIGDPIFAGRAQLTVTDDRFPGPQTGKVSGTLNWTGAATQPYTVNVSGSWTCMFSTETGPA